MRAGQERHAPCTVDGPALVTSTRLGLPFPALGISIGRVTASV
jgi:hypothetical protein